jgi:NUMOD4 motif-containing protein/HNH endonuclease
MNESAIPAIEGEIWRDVPGYENLYRVSNRGRVRSLPRMTVTGMHGGRMLKPARRGHPGYERLYVTLCKGTRATNWSTTVHQLVMLTFAGPCPEGQEVRHLDGNPFNNRWEPGDEAETRAAGGNLFYGTHIENARDMVEHGNANGCGKLGSEHPVAKLTEDLVRQIRSDYAAGGVTERVLAARHGVNVATIHALLVRRTWKHVA